MVTHGENRAAIQDLMICKKSKKLTADYFCFQMSYLDFSIFKEPAALYGNKKVCFENDNNKIDS